MGEEKTLREIMRGKQGRLLGEAYSPEPPAQPPASDIHELAKLSQLTMLLVGGAPVFDDVPLDLGDYLTDGGPLDDAIQSRTEMHRRAQRAESEVAALQRQLSLISKCLSIAETYNPDNEVPRKPCVSVLHQATRLCFLAEKAYLNARLHELENSDLIELLRGVLTGEVDYENVTRHADEIASDVVDASYPF